MIRESPFHATPAEEEWSAVHQLLKPGQTQFQIQVIYKWNGMWPQLAPPTLPVLTILSGSHVCHSLHLGMDHALFKLHICIKYLTEIPHRCHCLDSLLVDISSLGGGRGEGVTGGYKEGVQGDIWRGSRGPYGGGHRGPCGVGHRGPYGVDIWRGPRYVQLRSVTFSKCPALM